MFMNTKKEKSFFFQTCLFGVAAMLWSAADYKLPANQEPALSEELENMLISMTQDAHWVRPSASDVLQVCQSKSPHKLNSTPIPMLDIISI